MRRVAGLAAGRRHQAVRASRLATRCHPHQPERRRSRPSGEEYPPQGVAGRSGYQTLAGDRRDTAQRDPALRVIRSSGLPSGWITGVYARSDRDERPPMPVSHAHATAVTSTDEQDGGEVPGLLEVLAQVPDPRQRRGRRYCLVFVLAVAVACVLAGAKTFREIGDQAADLPQEVLARLGGKPRPLRRAIIVPSEKRIRTLIQGIGAQKLDDLIGGWLRSVADAGRMDGPLTAIAIDGKWLRGVADGQVKLFAAMLHEEKVMIAQHRIPDETTETTQVRELLDRVDLDNAVVTGDAAHAQHETAAYIAGRKEDGNRGSDYFLFAQRQPALAAARHLRRDPGRRPARARPCGTGLRARPDHQALHLGHRCRRPGLPARRPRSHGSAATATTSPVPRSARRSCTPSPAWTRNAPAPRTWPASPAASGASSRCTGCVRDTVWAEDQNTAYAGTGPQVMATLRNLAVSLLHLAGVTEITRTLQAITRDRTRMLSYLPL
jgi:hypothetical protein